MIHYRWSDHDRRWGPFIYARERRYRPIAIEITSNGDEDDRPFSTLRLRALGHTLIVILPPALKPWKRWVDTSQRSWSTERGGYWDMGRREYGFSLNDGYLSVALGRVTNDSSTEQRWGYFLPWMQWRHVRHSWFGLAGEHIADMPQWGERPARVDFKVRHAEEQRIEAAVPIATFEFLDFDGQRLTAATRINEREWRRGTGWWRWLSLVWPKKVRRSLDIRFSGETGKRKGSWKGGTIGTGIDMLPGELHEAAFRRYCAAEGRGMRFLGSTDILLESTNPGASA